MRNLTKFLAVTCFMLASSLAMAEAGIIRGTVYEESTGEPLFGVAVKIQGTTIGAITDFDGKFQINAEEGSYNIEASFISFKTVTITDLEVLPGEVTIIDAIWMQDAVEELEAVIVTAEVIKNSESALLTVKRKSANVLDGISSESFRQIGDANAGEAAKRVPGVSVEGGKYVYVRGLGDRYTKTTLNGVDIPGLDPDRNSIQIDVFPTSLIDNMVILKSFSADLPADFTGGIVNIETKDFPEERVIDASFGVSYTPAMHFSDDFIKGDASNTDFLGFDDGLRALPDNARQVDIPSPLINSSDGEITSFLNQFSPELGATQETNFMDFSLGLNFADQLEIGGGYKIGYLLSGSYKNSTTLYDDAFFGEYQLSQNTDQLELVRATTQEGSFAENNVLLGGLAGIAIKNSNNKLKFNVMRLQNGESRAGQFDIDDDDTAVGKSGFIGVSDNLEYNERSVTNFLLNGEHFLADGAWQIDWRGSATISSQDDPDIRKSAFTISSQGEPIFSAGAAGLPLRLWRELDETNLVGKVDITRKYQLFNEDAKLKFGVSHVYKERDYEILTYSVNFFGNQPEWTGDPNEVWTDDNIFPNGTMYLASGNIFPNPNEYNGTVNNTGVYASNEFVPFPKLKSILGVRMENFVQRHTGRSSQVTGLELDDEKVLDAVDFFPSVNLIYSLQEKMNLRFGFSRTIARPSFKELTFAQIVDPISNRIFNGGFFQYDGEWDGDLTETRISNFDIRWELFMDRGQIFSVSGFYKAFDDPIELVRIPAATTTNEFQPRNVGDGQVFGIEVEYRKSLDFISPNLSDFSINGNVTIVESIIDISPTEFSARETFARTGQTIDDTRDMAGQAPWIVNAGILYNNIDIGFDAGFFYNVKGETLTVVGSGLFPDVYSQPFHSLNFNMNKIVGAQGRWTLNVSASNILNDDREEFYQSFRASDQIFQRISPETSIGFGASYSF